MAHKELSEKLKKVLDDHAKWLLYSQSADDAERHRYKRLAISYLNARELTLEACVLAEAYLESSNFRNANLRFADFRSADLKYSDFTEADLHEAKFKGADLQSATFRLNKNAIIREVRFGTIISTLRALNTGSYTLFFSAVYGSIACTFEEMVSLINTENNIELNKQRIDILIALNNEINSLKNKSSCNSKVINLQDLRATPALVKLLSQAERITRRNINSSKDVTAAEDSIELAKNIDDHNAEVIARLIKNAPSAMELFSLLYPGKDYDTNTLAIMRDTLDWIFHSQLPKQKNE